MSRPDIGTLRGAASLNDESYLDFVEGLRGFNLGVMVPRLVRSADALGGAMAQDTPPATASDLFHKLDTVPAAQLARRMMRSTQMMMWRGAGQSYRKIADDLGGWLDATERAAPALLRIDPDFAYPDYIRQQDIHLQPGSYQDDALAGFVYHYGSKIFFTGGNDDDHLHRAMAEWCPIEGEPTLILDIGCGIGQSTTAMKQRFPNAEVHGIDVAEPMLRYAHGRAQDMGLDVHFSQQSAAQTDFADNSVDGVLSMILFHELPRETAEGVVREMARILRPGATMTIIDFPHIPPEELSGRHCMRLFDSWYNGEPFAPGFVYSDFTALLRQHFDDVDDNYRPAATSTGALQIRVCRKAS
ncbi:class I SAM-dependent methyltransferase [Sphingobium boeckii]|uniref:Ubiquinone/menaquinone biosynthesis C-methylase UbiE n=1 Tax=Sphingobium boeckii TaxID=1082345 RepID=A0A7W9EF48_9SPHN|nr:class I SAM-dependent methyltransferase [Sphingobium boeckii]MBB5685341.1 ubiquinone/menaquinone biosynthesis C-methylase UbiE [Sphingobium boeckii]